MITMHYEVFIYNTRSKKREHEQVFDKIMDARKYGFWLLKTTRHPNKETTVEVVFRGWSTLGKKEIVTRDWFRIKQRRGIVYYESEDGWIVYLLNEDGSLGVKLKG